jgi:hypothetical protein
MRLTRASSRFSTCTPPPEKNARLGQCVVVEPGVAVEVVVADVQHRRRVRIQTRRGFQLEARQFEHPDLRQGAAHRPGRPSARPARPERCCRRRRRATCRRRAQMACQRRRGGLAVGAGDRQHPCALASRAARSPGEQLDLADNRDAGGTACITTGRSPGAPVTGPAGRRLRAAPHRTRPAKSRRLRAAAQQPLQTGRRGARIGHAHPRTLPHAQRAASHSRHVCQRLFMKSRRGPEHREPKPVLPCVLCSSHRIFSVDSPNSTSRMVMIQKRTTTCVSFQPVCSKWWCRGAMRRMRRPSPYFLRCI